ncbi:putative Copper acquisition factor BIM1-like domain-containing protein [Seiridium unicorne]|uniref:Copper acquisition factor BIM1-like domain-containing protein n=1 Tax=Seiridium unicorne TaxID=138068 RepID=A0ABR2V7Z7_9PEZI
MAPLSSVTAAALMFLSSCQAHFLLTSPTPAGTFDEDSEGNAPCGGITPSFSSSNITNFAVGGDAIATQLGHPQANWLYRITTDESASGNWTQIYPIVQQSGLKFFCIPTVTVPESFIGQTAVLSVVADAPDGLLYQCATVKFVSGVNSNLPSACVNTSGVTGSFDTDDKLTALVDSTSSGSDPSSTTGTTTSGTSSSTSSNTGNAAPATYGGSVEGLRSLVTVGAMVAIGAALMI